MKIGDERPRDCLEDYSEDLLETLKELIDATISGDSLRILLARDHAEELIERIEGRRNEQY